MMQKVPVNYFENAGYENTKATLAAAKTRAAQLGIKQIVVATTTGQTALDCAEMMPEMDTIVGVMMHAVNREVHVKRASKTVLAPHPEIVEKAKNKGVKIYRGILGFAGVSSAISKEAGGMSSSDLIARTYMTISTGTKVAVECMLMAADAGFLDMDKDVITIGGYRGGADTALVVRPAFTHTFFDCKVREFIALPRNSD